MPIRLQILGKAGWDNALLVRVDTGQGIHRLLFDCGQGCLDDVTHADVQNIEHLFFSHLHLDHVAGFDAFLRANAARPWPVRVWGPPDTCRIVHHRLRGVMWNLHADLPGEWHVTDIGDGTLTTASFLLREAFEQAHPQGTKRHAGVILTTDAYQVEVYLLDHRTASCAYIVREHARWNVDSARLGALGLKAGAWVRELKDRRTGVLNVNGEEHDVRTLRDAVLRETPGMSVAYLTDFLLDDAAMTLLADVLHGCSVMVCESQYRHEDLALAVQHHHMTNVQAATLAWRANVGELVLMHVSDRYGAFERGALLEEARRVFPRTRFPEEWNEGRG